MDCLIVGMTQHRRRQWLYTLEDLGEDWRCTTVQDAARAREALCGKFFDLMVVCPLPDGEAFVSGLAASPLLSPPFILTDGWHHPLADAEAKGAAQCASVLQLMQDRQCGRIPRLALLPLPAITCLARGLIRAMEIRPTLHACAFLPDMIALTVVHPPLLHALTKVLYPLCAGRFGLSTACVERSLRLMVESAWSHTSLEALERFFGHSVDPERGKPTNKEFLARMQERVTLSAARLYPSGALQTATLVHTGEAPWLESFSWLTERGCLLSARLHGRDDYVIGTQTKPLVSEIKV